MTALALYVTVMSYNFPLNTYLTHSDTVFPATLTIGTYISTLLFTDSFLYSTCTVKYILTSCQYGNSKVWPQNINTEKTKFVRLGQEHLTILNEEEWILKKCGGIQVPGNLDIKKWEVPQS